MTTTREEFEAWFADRNNPDLHAYGEMECIVPKEDAYPIWQAAHLAGQRAMRDRAARHCDNFSLAVSDSEWANGYATALKDAACGIQALEVKP